MESENHRNASVIDNELHINNNMLPFQIRNLNQIPEDYSSTESEESRSDGQPHERLLLSSARQNVTNRNTLIFSPRSGGFPLRRSNAIRFGRCPHAPNEDPPDLSVTSKELQKYIVSLLEFVAANCSWLGQSPLFVGHSSKHHKIEVPASEHLFACLDTTMDAYISQRNQGMLWRRPTPEPSAGDSRKRSADSAGPQRKRRKISANNNLVEPQTKSIRNPADGATLALSQLSYKQKLAIMSVVYTSYLRDGSNFSLFGLNKAQLNMAFSSVNYEKKKVMGVFTSYGQPDEVLDYIMGSTGSLNLPRDRALIRRMRLAEKVVTAVKESGREDVNSPFLFPFSGSIIDFQHNDLRFLRHIRMSKNVPIRNLHLARTKTARARLQLQEWMKMNPFKQFKDVFLMKTLTKLRRNLCNFDNVSLAVQEDTLDMARGLRKHLDVIAGGSEPRLSKFNDAEAHRETWHDVWQEHSSNHESPFVQEWDKKLSDKLAEFLMCEEHCLLNVQLNYVLFTVKVDTVDFLDAYILHHLLLLPSNKRDEFSKILNKEQETSRVLRASRESVMVCSINRKTGGLEINNTRAVLNFRNINMPDSHLAEDPNDPEEGNSYDFADLDDWRHDGEERFRNPDDGECAPTLLRGHYRRSGGGCSVYGVV
ncbi:hypothetical protein QA089_000295 [Meyerozyma guilliermondii]